MVERINEAASLEFETILACVVEVNIEFRCCREVLPEYGVQLGAERWRF
jgi:hypothetical protein